MRMRKGSAACFTPCRTAGTTCGTSSFYGRELCEGHFCPSYHYISREEKLALLHILDDWYLYGLCVTDIDLVREYFRLVGNGVFETPRPERFRKGALREIARRFFSFKLDWPFRSEAVNRLGKYYFDGSQYMIHHIDYEKLGCDRSRFDRIFLSLSSEFGSLVRASKGKRSSSGAIDESVAAYARARPNRREFRLTGPPRLGSKRRIRIPRLGTRGDPFPGGGKMKSMEKEILFSKEAIAGRVRELAAEISRDYAGRELVVIGILKGAFVFMADLIRALTVPCMVDFTQLASYGSGTVSSGNIVIRKDIGIGIEGKDVLIVEDIVDTGLTLSFLVKTLRERSPRSLKVCVFLDKKMRRKVPFTADYTGFTIDDGFVVGYGLDCNEQDRALPEVYVVKE